MGASIASAAGRGVQASGPRDARGSAHSPRGLRRRRDSVRADFLPRGTAARAPGRTAATAATTATRAGSSRRGALTVTCAKKKNGRKRQRGQGQETPRRLRVCLGSRRRAEPRRLFVRPGATPSSGDGVWDSIQVGGADGRADRAAPTWTSTCPSTRRRRTTPCDRPRSGSDSSGSSSSSTTSADGLMRSMERRTSRSPPRKP